MNEINMFDVEQLISESPEKPVIICDFENCGNQASRKIYFDELVGKLKYSFNVCCECAERTEKEVPRAERFNINSYTKELGAESTRKFVRIYWVEDKYPAWKHLLYKNVNAFTAYRKVMIKFVNKSLPKRRKKIVLQDLFVHWNELLVQGVKYG